MIDFNRFDNYCFYFQHSVLRNYLLFLLQINRSSESEDLNAPINGPGWGGGGGGEEGANPGEFDIFRFLNVNFLTLGSPLRVK